MPKIAEIEGTPNPNAMKFILKEPLTWGITRSYDNAAQAQDDPLARETRGLALSRAMDRINQRYGRNAVSVGPLNGGRLDRVGTKIAFGRIPELSEFHE